MVELVESGECRDRDDPLVCLEVAGEGGALYAWFLASDIRAGALADPEFQLSVDAMVSDHRPRIPEDPCLPKAKYVLIFWPEEECWTPWKRYRGSLAD